MNYYTHETRDGLIMVLQNEFYTKQEEYTVASIFKSYGNLFFAQIVGTASPKPFLGQAYEVSKTTYDAKNNMYTIWYKDVFNYKFPLRKGEKRLVPAATEEAAWAIIEKLIGLDKKTILEYFDYQKIKDEGPSKRVAIMLTHNDRKKKMSTVDGQKVEIDEIDEIERKPVYFKGGEVGNING